jgi:hypothetical protein
MSPHLFVAKRSARSLELTGWPHQLRIDKASRDVLNPEAPPCRGEPLVAIETPTPDSTHPDRTHYGDATRFCHQDTLRTARSQ